LLTLLPIQEERTARFCAIMIVGQEDIRSLVSFRDEHWHGESPLFDPRSVTKPRNVPTRRRLKSYLEPMFPRILIVLSSQPRATVKGHKCDQIDRHPALWLVAQNDLLEVFQHLLPKRLEETERENHVQLLDHNRR
jgi:hypothetical protein